MRYVRPLLSICLVAGNHPPWLMYIPAGKLYCQDLLPCPWILSVITMFFFNLSSLEDFQSIQNQWEVLVIFPQLGAKQFTDRLWSKQVFPYSTVSPSRSEKEDKRRLFTYCPTSECRYYSVATRLLFSNCMLRYPKTTWQTQRSTATYYKFGKEILNIC